MLTLNFILKKLLSKIDVHDAIFKNQALGKTIFVRAKKNISTIFNTNLQDSEHTWYLNSYT